MNLRLRKIDAVIIVIMIVIAGFVLYKIGYVPKKEDSDIPDIQFFKDDKNRTLTVISVSAQVLWAEDIEIEGTCDKSSLSRFVEEGDQITECVGTINIWYKPTNTLLYTYKFPLIPKFPSSIIPGNMRDVSPQDEGVHFNKLGNIREWWYFTVVFSEESQLPGWTATIGFCHLAWGDLRGTFKPDLLVVTLHSPDGKEYGGMINKQRKEILGVLGPPTLEANTPGVDLKYEDSWAKGEAPHWHVHTEDENIDQENEIIIDLDFFSHSSPLWLHSSRPIDMGNGYIANYIFLGCDVSGTVKLDGLEFKVKGTGHHEHSWSLGVLKIAFKGWDWVHITLDNGWNIYYSKYYRTRQILSSKTSKINPFASLVITTDKGEKITKLEDIDITIKNSDKLFLLLKMPTEIGIVAKPGATQLLLKTYEINLDLSFEAKNAYEKLWKFPTYVGMKVGLINVTGTIRWSDDEGIHDIDLNGIGTTWNMRRF